MDTGNRAPQKSGGGLMQLVAWGAPDVYLIGNTSNPKPYNMRDSMASRWFVKHVDGFAKVADIDDESQNSSSDNNESQTKGGILDHVPPSMAPMKGSLLPFIIREERLANPWFSVELPKYVPWVADPDSI